MIKKFKDIKGIIGLDVSIASTGFVRFTTPFDIGNPSQRMTVGKGTDYGTMIERLAYSSEIILSDIGPTDLVFMEGYSYGSFNTEVLAQLGGIIKVGVWQRTGIAPIIVSPMTLKKFILGSGKGQQKEDIKLGAYKKWGVEFKTSDEVDAYALARLGLKVYNNNPDFEYERECVLALTRSKIGTVSKKTGKRSGAKRNPNMLELERAGIYEVYQSTEDGGFVEKKPKRSVRKFV